MPITCKYSLTPILMPLLHRPAHFQLFVGNIPHQYREGHLLALFETAGHVVELAIVRDRVTEVSPRCKVVLALCG